MTGAGSKETRAFRQTKKSYDATVKYGDIQAGKIENSKKISENIKEMAIGGAAVGIEETIPKGYNSFNNLINGTSKSMAFNPYLSSICGFAN